MSKISQLAGTGYRVQYKPEFSDECIAAIKEMVTPSMINSPDDSDETGLYAIDQVNEFMDAAREDSEIATVHKISRQDFDIHLYIKNSLQIHYIEI